MLQNSAGGDHQCRGNGGRWTVSGFMHFPVPLFALRFKRCISISTFVRDLSSVKHEYRKDEVSVGVTGFSGAFVSYAVHFPYITVSVNRVFVYLLNKMS